MIVRCNKESLPRCWSKAYPTVDRILLEKDIGLNSLYMKLLVFPTVKELRHFWSAAGATCHGGGVKKAMGIVSHLQAESRDYSKSDCPDPVLNVDRRYFAAMGLAKGYLGMGVITHECVHAAFAYANRTKARNPWAHFADRLDEELVCYPAGVIARLVVTALRDSGMFESNKIKL